MSSSDEVSHEIMKSDLLSGKRFSVRSQYGFTLGIDVEHGYSACATRLQMYAINGFLAKHFHAIEDYLDGKGNGCPK